VTSDPAEPQPMARLFATGYRALVDGLHERLAARGWTDVRPNFGFVLLACRTAPIRSTDIAQLLGVSKQAASKVVDAMEEGGYVRRTEHPEDHRAKLVALTPRGHQLLAEVEEVYRALETKWAGVLGRGRLEALRADLTMVLMATHGGRLPVIRST